MTSATVRRLLATTVVMSTTVLAAEPQRVLTQRQAYVMGTRVELSAFAATRAEGLKSLETALATLEAADAELSTWKAASEMSAINRMPVGRPRALQPSLCGVFLVLFAWHTASGGAFDPGIGALTDAWAIHESGRTPSDRELHLARARSGLRLFDFDRDRCTLTRKDDARMDVGAFGKGEALDRVAAKLRSVPWMIDFGGQVAVGSVPPGRDSWDVRVAHPNDRTRGIITVRMKSGSLSTSSGSERDHHVDGTRIGHHLDPRTGRPATYDGAVVVWHERSLVADILSTVLYVMGPDEGVQWAEAHGIAAAYLIPAGDGVRTAATKAFAQLMPTIEQE